MTCEGQCIYETPPDQIAFRLAVKIRNYLMRFAPDLSPADRHRMMQAAQILESGTGSSAGFAQFGDMTLSELKRRYVVYKIEAEGSFRAAARVLAIEPSTVCRIYHRGRDSSNGRTQAHPKSLSPSR